MFDNIAAMDEGQVMVRIFCSLFCALIIVFMTSKLIGPANKAAWFKKREKFSFFLKRGFLGEEWHFGYPRTREGFGVAFGMLVAIVATTYLVFVV